MTLPMTYKTLPEIVAEYFKFRGYVNPTSDQALKHLVAEVGEMADADVNSDAEWVRNTERERDLAGEVGEVQMMLIVYAQVHGLDPVGCMLDKMRSKGFDPRLIGNISG